MSTSAHHPLSTDPRISDPSEPNPSEPDPTDPGPRNAETIDTEPMDTESPWSEPESVVTTGTLALQFRQVGMMHAAVVGGKAASLGEMYRELVAKGLRVPNGFATTADAYVRFLDSDVPAGSWDGVQDEEHLHRIRMVAARARTLREALHSLFEGATVDDHLDMHGRTALARSFVRATPIPTDVEEVLRKGYAGLCAEYGDNVDVAVRSSATKEDSAEASFAGQYESFLNICGPDDVLDAWKRCAASAFTERAVGYQIARGMDPLEGAVAVIVMKMIRSDLAASGVMFTIDPDVGNPNVICVSSTYGLGELVVQGSVTPDTIHDAAGRHPRAARSRMICSRQTSSNPRSA